MCNFQINLPDDMKLAQNFHWRNFNIQFCIENNLRSKEIWGFSWNQSFVTFIYKFFISSIFIFVFDVLKFFGSAWPSSCSIFTVKREFQSFSMISSFNGAPRVSVKALMPHIYVLHNLSATIIRFPEDKLSYVNSVRRFYRTLFETK